MYCAKTISNVCANTGSGGGSSRGSFRDQATEAPNQSLPVQSCRILAAAALNAVCPDGYSGNGGLGKSAGRYRIHSAPSMFVVPFPGPPQHRIVLPLIEHADTSGREAVRNWGRSSNTPRSFFVSAADISISSRAYISYASDPY